LAVNITGVESVLGFGGGGEPDGNSEDEGLSLVHSRRRLERRRKGRKIHHGEEDENTSFTESVLTPATAPPY